METSFWTDSKTWVAIAFVVFFILFGKRLWRAIAELLDGRANAIRAELAEAARLRREAEDMLREARLRRDRALDDARQLIAGAQAEAERLTSAAARETEAAARRREQMAMERIAAAEKAAVDEVRLAAADLATRAARQVIAEGLTPEQDSKLIDQSIRHLPSALAVRQAA
jgi:F-type H+-transporting ATPase subunit b